MELRERPWPDRDPPGRVSGAVRRAATSRGIAATPRGAAAIGDVAAIAGEDFAVSVRSLRGKLFALENESGKRFVGEREAIVDFAAPFLVRTLWLDVIAHVRKLVGALAAPGAAIDRAEVWELDLCVDLAAATFGEVDRDAFVGRLRTSNTWETLSTRTRARAETTGMRIGDRRALSIMLYDKIAELTARPDERPHRRRARRVDCERLER